MTNSGLVPVLYIMPISALQGLGTCVGCRTSVRVDVWQIRVDSVLELRSLCNKTCRVVVSSRTVLTLSTVVLSLYIPLYAKVNGCRRSTSSSRV